MPLSSYFLWGTLLISTSYSPVITLPLKNDLTLLQVKLPSWSTENLGLSEEPPNHSGFSSPIGALNSAYVLFVLSLIVILLAYKSFI